MAASIRRRPGCRDTCCPRSGRWRQTPARRPSVEAAEFRRSWAAILHVISGRFRCSGAEQAFDDVKRTVDPGRDPTGGDDFTVIVKSHGWIHGRRWRQFAQQIETAVMRRDAKTIEQARFREHE